MSKVTQQVIADKIGVSRSTVSLVVSGRRDIAIPEGTRKRIFDAVRRYGYKYPKAGARKTGNIGYLIHAAMRLEDPYYHRFWSGIQREAARSGRHVLISQIDPHAQLPDIVRLGKVDGLIIESNITTEWLKAVSAVVPVVLLDRMAEGNVVDSVMPDNGIGIKKAFSHLFSLGHRRIAFFGMKPLNLCSIERVDGYLSALKEYNRPVEAEYIRMPEMIVGGQEEVDRYTEETLNLWRNMPIPPTAVVTTGDIYAVSLIKAAHRLGVVVPGDLSVVGCDNTHSAVVIVPSLTSLDQPMEEMGRCAMEMLLARIEESDQRPRRCVRFDMNLVVRESTGPAKSTNGGGT